MKRLLKILFCLCAFAGVSQNNLNEKLSLMPWPQYIKDNPAKFIVNSDVTISIHGNDKHHRVRNVAINFLRRLSQRTGVFIEEGFPLIKTEGSIEIHFDKATSLSIETDESYKLEVNNDKILITANEDVGAIRALETLLQLATYNTTEFYFPGVLIEDSPRFVWRGLMIDVSRHFHPVDVIKRNLKAMASVKLNVFHWHLTDDQGFRVESKVYPKLHELGSDGLYYTQNQIKDVVAYADKLGIRVVPEFDVPGHASAILTAYPELGSKDGYQYSIERYAGVFDPTLDPTKDNTYTFLDNLFTEMAPLFPDTYFHIGGDENEGKHWDENQDIQAFKEKHSLSSNHDLQTYFNIKLERILNRLGKKLMGWDEILTDDMPTTAVIHSWRGENEGFPKGGTLIEAAKKGYYSVLSEGFYIDRVQTIDGHYLVEPIGDVELTDEERSRILGGEVTMWSELVTPLTIDSRIWPRTAAIAERLWSSKEVNDLDNMKLRLKDVSFRLEELGITHIKNRDVILRNMTNNQDISSLITLSKVCEPLKVYTRNQGGTEYKTYSPFTLFADACVVDASDALTFKSAVKKFNTPKILELLQKWSENHSDFQKLEKSPILNPLEPLSENLSIASKLLYDAVKNTSITKQEIETLNGLFTQLEKPYEDVELIIINDLKTVLDYCQKNYLTE